MSVERRAKIITIEGTDCSGKETQSNKLLKNLTAMGYNVKKYSFPDYELPTGRIVGECYLGKWNKRNLTLEEIDILLKLFNKREIRKLLKKEEKESGASYKYLKLLKKGLTFLKNETTSFFKEGAVNVDPLVASTLYAANRREKFLNEIEAEMYTSDIIILDRYTTSNLGHQGGKAKNDEKRNLLYNCIDKLEYEIMELPRPDMTIFLHMPRKAILDLMKNRTELDEHERNEEHLIESEKSYLDLVKRYNWEYICSSKTDEYKSLEDLKTPDEISEEVLGKVINKISNNKKMTRFLEKE